MRPSFRFVGGTIVLLVEGTIQWLNHLQALDFVKQGSPGLYTFIVGGPFSVALILTALGFIVPGCIGIWKDRKPPSQTASVHTEVHASSSGIAIGGNVSAGPGAIVAIGGPTHTGVPQSPTRLIGNVLQAYVKYSITGGRGDPESLTVTDAYLLTRIYFVNEGRAEPAVRGFECSVNGRFQTVANDAPSHLDPFVIVQNEPVLVSGSFQTEYRSVRYKLANICKQNAAPLLHGIPREGWIRFEFRQRSEADFQGASLQVTVVDALGVRHSLAPCDWPWPQPHTMTRD